MSKSLTIAVDLLIVAEAALTAAPHVAAIWNKLAEKVQRWRDEGHEPTAAEHREATAQLVELKKALET